MTRFYNIPGQETGMFERRLAPIHILEDERNKNQRIINQWHDEQMQMLRGMEINDEQYLQGINEIRMGTRKQELELEQQIESRRGTLDLLGKLVESGELPQEIATRSAYRAVGIGEDVINSMFPGQGKPIDWIKEHQVNVTEQNRLASFLGDFGVKKNKLYRLDAKGQPAEKASPQEIEHYNMTLNLLDWFQTQEREVIFPNLSTMQQTALRGQRVVSAKKSKGIIGIFESIGKAAVSKGDISPMNVAMEYIKHQPIYAYNADTNERIVSRDGGKKWSPIK